MGQEITKALVLHEMPIGDYDKRLILLTKNFGKITAFVKGARKANSPLLAGSQIFSYGDYVLYKGKQSYNVNQIHLLNTFHSLRNSIESLTYGLYILEFSEFVSVENNCDHDLMKLILLTLKQIEKKRIPAALIKGIFELKAMSYMGLAPGVNACVECHYETDLNHFSIKMGGVLCKKCCHKDINALVIGDATRYALHYIIVEGTDQLFQFNLDYDIFEEFNIVIKHIIDYNFNKTFKTMEFLKTVF